jgi:hypothetical protein
MFFNQIFLLYLSSNIFYKKYLTELLYYEKLVKLKAILINIILIIISFLKKKKNGIKHKNKKHIILILKKFIFFSFKIFNFK